MSEVVVSGYVSLDRIVLIDSELKSGHTSIISNHDNSKIYYGGCPINIAYSLNKLNVKTTPLIRVGDDYESTGFKQFLEDSNVPLDGITQITGVNTSNCYLVEDKLGNHHTIFYPGAMSNEYFEPMNQQCFNSAKLGVITVGPLQDNIEFLKKCKSNQTDLIFGAKLDKTAFPKAFLKEVLTYSKIIFCNEFEEEDIVKTLDLKSITDFFTIGNAEVIVVTHGKEGSQYYSKDKKGVHTEKIGIVETDNCVDTTGSGDAYMSGFIYGYLNNYSIKDSCKLGSTLSHFIIQKMGCISNVPTLEELLIKFNESRDL